MRIDLSSGGWVELRDTPISYGARKKLLRERNDPDDVTAGDEAYLRALIVACSYGPIEDPDTLDKIPAPDVDQVTQTIIDAKLLDRLVWLKTGPDPAPDSPTEPSSV